MERATENQSPARESLLSVRAPWWPVFFWLFVGQLAWEGVMVALGESAILSGMGLVERIRFVKTELSDDVLVSAAVSMIIVDIGRSVVFTSIWLKGVFDRHLAAYDERVRARALAEGRAEGLAEGRNEILNALDEDTRKEVELKLRRNGG